MAETRVVITADADQAVLEFNRLRSSATGSIQQIAQAGEQLNRAGVSAGQLRAAMAGLPAQITDVVVSLQGGQAPLTVLLQQGGQIVGQFGNVGNALRGVASYVTGLVNPFTVAAAAGTVLAVAFYKGSQESEEFRKSLALTGNAVGATTSELIGMSAATAKAAEDTKSHAADALNQLVQTGRVGKENLQQLATATVLANKEIGIKVADTVSTFADLAKSPLEASEKLTEKYHYLTLATYQQIKALQDQGRADDAGRVAQSAYADAITQRAKDVDASLGYLTRGWNALGSAAHKAWDWMLDIGREDTFEQKLEKANAALEEAKRKRLTFIGAGADGKADLDKAQARVDALNAEKDRKERIAAIDAGRIQLQEAGIAWDKEGEKFLTRREQLERDIAASRKRGLEAGVSDAEIAQREAAIRKQYSDIFNAGIDGQIEAIKRRGVVEDTVAARSMSALVAAREAGLDNSFQAQQQYAQAVEALDQAQFARERARLEQELKLTAQKANSERDQAGLRGQINELDEKSISRKIQLEQQLFNLDVNAERAALGVIADKLDKRDEDLRGINEQIKKQKDANAVIGMGKQQVAAYSAALVEERARRLESDAAIADTILGWEALAEKMRDSAKALRELTTAQADGVARTLDFERQKNIWEGIEHTAHDTFLSIEQNGKGAFDRLYSTLKNGLLELLYQMTAKQWIMNIGAQVSGYSALAGAGNAAGAAASAGGAGNLLSGASSISSAYNLATAGLTNTLGGGISAIGSWAGSSALADFGAGFSGSAAAEQIAATLAGETIPAMSAAASAGTALASALSTAVPWIAGAAVAYKAFDALFSDGPESDTRLTFGSNNKAGNISINERGNEGKSDSYIAGASTNSAFGTFGVTSTFWAPAESKAVQDFVKTVGLADDALAKYLTTAEKASVTSYLTGKTDTAHVGAEGQIDSADAGKALAQVFNDRIMNILEGIEPGLSKLEQNFQGTSAELATEVESLLAYRSALNDSGEAVFGAKVTLQQIAALKTPTEATSAALTRITSEFAATNQVVQLLGKDVSTAFGAAGLAGEAMRAQIILLSGGLSNFTAAASSFAQNYLSDAERLGPVSKQLDAQLAALGLSAIPKTKDEFKSLVMGLDLSSESGQKLYAGLMNLQDAFAQVHASEKTAADVARERADLQDKLDELTMTQAQLAEKARNAIDGHNRALYDQVAAAQAAKDAVKDLLDNTNQAYSTLQAVVAQERDHLDTVYQAATDGLQAGIDKVTGAVSNLQNLSQALHSTLDSMAVPGQEKAEREQAQAQLQAALAIAKAGGPLPDADVLKNALATVGKDASGQFSSYLDYQRDLYLTKNTVAGLAGYTDTQLSTDQLMLKSLQSQKTALDEAHKADLARLDGILATSKNQVDLLNGVSTALVSLPQALAELAASISKAMANPGSAALQQTAVAYQDYLGRTATSSELDFWQQQATKGVDVAGAIKNSDEAKIQALYKSLLGRTGDAAGVDAWEAAVKGGMSWEQVKQGFLGSDEYKRLHPPGFAAGGDHMGGLRLVGENGPELEATGPSRIFNASQTRSMLGSANAELVAEIRALRAEVRELRAAAASTADSTGEVAKVVRRVGGRGDYFAVKVITAKEPA
ncbi:phage-related minor tail protein [Duganella sp. 1224]|uniref:phage tail length tape measure family protein n=1 Tax=Duganella sp. 1224 TaxID=2587052 RepID=UPI0015CD2513|nr:phage tail length tape measure family protein [Duganella sp. 1224]NYE62186.1 phage-related minor tail protein [Duganella sp. 1224]